MQPDMQRIVKDWAKSRDSARLERLPGTALHVRPETKAWILTESTRTGRSVGAICREFLELGVWLHRQGKRDRDVALALERFLSTGGAEGD